MTYEWLRLYDLLQLHRDLFGRGPWQASQLREGDQRGRQKLWIFCLRGRWVGCPLSHLTFLIVLSGRLMTFFGVSLPVFGFRALTRVFGSIFPLCKLPWSEGGAPYQRPNGIWFPAEASDVPDQDPISFILLCSRAVPHGYSLPPQPFSCILRLYQIGIKSIYTDSLICQHKWLEFIVGVRSDWSESILYVGVVHLLHYSVTDVSDSDRVLCY